MKEGPQKSNIKKNIPSKKSASPPPAIKKVHKNFFISEKSIIFAPSNKTFTV